MTDLMFRALPSTITLLAFATSIAFPVGAASGEQDAREQVQAILETTGVQGGLVIHLGCEDGRLAAAFAEEDGFLVHGLDRNPQHVAAARQWIHDQGLYGRVSVERLRGRRLPYADNLVRLLIIEPGYDVSPAEIARALCPEGTALLKYEVRKTKDEGDIGKHEPRPARGSDQDWAGLTRQQLPDGSVICRKPWPEEIDEWTHYLHDATGNAVADDSVVGPPRRFQWIAEPRWTRSHDHLASLSAMVSAHGRVFYIEDEAPIASVAIQPQWKLVARDAFSGVLLWKRPLGPWEGHLRGFRTGPTELARRLVAAGDRVYVTLGYDQPISVLNAATGATLQTYDQTTNALEILWSDGMVLAVIGDRPPDNTAGAAKPLRPTNIWHWWPIYEDTPPRKHLVALRAETGETLWKKDDADTAELMPTTLAAGGGRVFYHSHEAVVALDASSGRQLWSTPRPISRRRPAWSAPTLVVHGDVVLSGDRAADSPPHPAAPETDKESQWIVDSHGGLAPKGQIMAFSAATGEQLWQAPCRECYNAPVDVLVADDLVWSGYLVGKSEPGITAARDVQTGEVVRQRPADQEFFQIVMGHHRCYRNKATEKYLVLGRDGIELIDTATGRGHGNAWVRGTCQYGVMPCNGLIYSPPHSCACHIEFKLDSFNVLAPAGDQAGTASQDDVPERLEKGPAYASLLEQAARPTTRPVAEDDWPTYRHDAARSGRSSCRVPAEIEQAWVADLPGHDVTSPVIAAGRVLVACPDQHLVLALDADSGRRQWSYTAGGRVDSPPSIHGRRVIFGSADGWITCLRAEDGRLAWRFQAAPAERRIVSYGRLESAWPVHGSVLVQDEVVYAVAGRSSFLDGGMVLHRLDARTGEPLSATPITTPALPDVLSSDGTSIFMRHRRFDLSGEPQASDVTHLYSPAGFLDDSWWHRTYWLVGTGMRSGWGSWPVSGNLVPAGRLLVMDEATVYGFGRFNQYHRDGAHVGLGQTRYAMYASPRLPADAGGGPAKRRAPGQAALGGDVSATWSRPLPLLARGMVLSDETIFVIGPPDVFAHPSDDITDRYHVASPEALQAQAAALAGEQGSLLLAVSAADGETLAEYRVPSLPAWDALAAAGGRLFLTTSGGHVYCYAGKGH